MIKEKFELAGKTVLVVGGRGYLGQKFCAALDEFGATVFSADLSAQSSASRKAPAAETKENIRQFDVDVTDKESVCHLVERVIEETLRIDVLVYCVTAKTDDFYLPYTEYSLESWQKVIRAEMDGLFLITQEVGRYMEAAAQGNIILLSSIYGVVGNDQRIYEGSNLSELYADNGTEENKIYSPASYPAVKGAVISLTRYLAAYWEGKNIRVNCVSPGGVFHPGENEEFVKKYNYHVPLGRKATVEEISSAVVFLASDASSYINGHNLVVDGGWTAW